MGKTNLFFAILIGMIFLMSGCIGPSENPFAMETAFTNNGSDKDIIPLVSSPNVTTVPNATEVAQSNEIPALEKASQFGTMLAYNINDAAMQAKTVKNIQNGWSGFRKDKTSYQALKNSLAVVSKERTAIIKKADFSVNREVAAYFTWNVIEPEKGQYDWELTDAIVQAAKESGIKLTAVVQPFATWDQKNTYAPPECKALDFAYYDYKAGAPNDWNAYENFLTKLAERYKGTVAYWEIGNEVEGGCGGFMDNAENYVKLLSISYKTIKKADPQARVLNGGALDVTGIKSRERERLLKEFFELGGGQYIDYFNLHYNIERSGAGGANPDSASFLDTLNFFNSLMEKNNGRKPLWITEFGTYSGTPSSQFSFQAGAGSQPSTQQQPKPDSQGGTTPKKQMSFPTQSQEFQAAWYFRNSIIGFANGANRIFIDLIGRDNDVIGGSAVFNLEGEPRLFATTLKTIAIKISGFSKAEKISEGQYRFMVNGKLVYVLWSGALPKEIQGKAIETDMLGTEDIVEASDISLRSDNPVFVELVPASIPG